MRERAEVVGRHESIKVQWRLQVETMRKEWEILSDSENTARTEKTCRCESTWHVYKGGGGASVNSVYFNGSLPIRKKRKDKRDIQNSESVVIRFDAW